MLEHGQRVIFRRTDCPFLDGETLTVDAEMKEHPGGATNNGGKRVILVTDDGKEAVSVNRSGVSEIGTYKVSPARVIPDPEPVPLWDGQRYVVEGAERFNVVGEYADTTGYHPGTDYNVRVCMEARDRGDFAHGEPHKNGHYSISEGDAVHVEPPDPAAPPMLRDWRHHKAV